MKAKIVEIEPPETSEPFESLELSDKEMIRDIHRAAVSVAHSKRLANIRVEHRNKLSSAATTLREVWLAQMRDAEGTPDFTAAENLQIFFGVALLILYTDMFPDAADKFTK